MSCSWLFVFIMILVVPSRVVIRSRSMGVLLSRLASPSRANSQRVSISLSPELSRSHGHTSHDVDFNPSVQPEQLHGVFCLKRRPPLYVTRAGSYQTNTVHPARVIECRRNQDTTTITDDRSPVLGGSLVHVPGCVGRARVGEPLGIK